MKHISMVVIPAPDMFLSRNNYIKYIVITVFLCIFHDKRKRDREQEERGALKLIV